MFLTSEGRLKTFSTFKTDALKEILRWTDDDTNSSLQETVPTAPFLILKLWYSWHKRFKPLCYWFSPGTYLMTCFAAAQKLL